MLMYGPPHLSEHYRCPWNSTDVGLVEDRAFPTSESETLAASFLHSFHQAIVLQCSGLSYRKFLNTLSTSALPSCRPVVMSAVLSTVQSLWLWHGQGSKSTVVLAAEGFAQPCASQGSPSKTFFFTPSNEDILKQFFIPSITRELTPLPGSSLEPTPVL